MDDKTEYACVVHLNDGAWIALALPDDVTDIDVLMPQWADRIRTDTVWGTVIKTCGHRGAIGVGMVIPARSIVLIEFRELLPETEPGAEPGADTNL